MIHSKDSKGMMHVLVLETFKFLLLSVLNIKCNNFLISMLMNSLIDKFFGCFKKFLNLTSKIKRLKTRERLTKKKELEFAMNVAEQVL